MKHFNKKNKLCISIIVIIYYCISMKYCYCISDDFKFMIDTVGIPEYNVLGEAINEQIYNVYNIIVYSDPIKIMEKTNRQRFKNVEKDGKWTENGTNLKGEYYILGTSYSGDLVTNVYFPVDFVAETTPDNWNFLYNEKALKSWNNVNNYKVIEQLEYMKNSNIHFDEIDYNNGTCNSYNLIEYDINANKIGLDKVMLETCATWKTSGVLSVNRLTNEGKIRYATFIIKPMAASADIKSELFVKDNIFLDKENNYFDISFGAKVINLNDYAKEEHIKKITSELYVNNKKIATVDCNKKATIKKNILYNILEEDFKENIKMLNIKVKSYLYTEFSADGLIKDEVEKNIILYKENLNKCDKEQSNNILVKKLEKINGEFFVSDLIKTKQTDKSYSEGIIESGRSLVVKIFDIKVNEKDIENLDVSINDKKIFYEIINVSLNDLVLKIKIDDNVVSSTIATWKYLKDNNGDYFKIDFRDIGRRISNPNILKIDFIKKEKIYETKFDTIDYFTYNMNYTFSQEITNKEEKFQKNRLEEWIK